MTGQTEFTQMADGRTFLVKRRRYEDIRDGADLEADDQPQLAELFTRHLDQATALEKRLGTWRAKAGALGRRIMERIMPDPHRINPRRIK